MVSLLSCGVQVLVKSLAGLSFTQAARCRSVPSALSAVQCLTERWFSKKLTIHEFQSPRKEAPKKPWTAYIRFSCRHQPIISKQHPEASFTQTAKLISSEWKALPEAERQRYREEARVDLMKYREMYKKYIESLNPEELDMLKSHRKQKLADRKKRKLKKEMKLFGKPKTPRNSFNIYLSEHYPEVKGESHSAKIKILARQWNDLSSSEKEVYKQLAEDDKIRYQNEMKVWEEQMIEIGRADLVGYHEKTRRLKLKS